MSTRKRGALPEAALVAKVLGPARVPLGPGSGPGPTGALGPLAQGPIIILSNMYDFGPEFGRHLSVWSMYTSKWHGISARMKKA